VTSPADTLALLRSRSYLMLLMLAALLGVLVSVVAYGFLALVSKLQGWIFTSLPGGLGFHGEPLWWPILPLVLAGVLVGMTIRYLPGKGGRSPADGFQMGEGPPSPIELPGIVFAALATLSLGVILGPEAPLIALGGGLGVCAVRLLKRDAPDRTRTVVAAAGSFAAISTLLGSPLLGAFLLMEASGLGGAMLELVLVPGWRASARWCSRASTRGPAWAPSPWPSPTCPMSDRRPALDSCGPWPSASWPRSLARPSAGSPCSCGHMPNDGSCWPLPWPA
jgi:H+/Cl- antiporter ClcA